MTITSRSSVDFSHPCVRAKVYRASQNGGVDLLIPANPLRTFLRVYFGTGVTDTASIAFGSSRNIVHTQRDAVFTLRDASQVFDIALYGGMIQSDIYGIANTFVSWQIYEVSGICVPNNIIQFGK